MIALILRRAKSAKMFEISSKDTRYKIFFRIIAFSNFSQRKQEKIRLNALKILAYHFRLIILDP